jgi:uncharacterized integral membrane protein
MIEQVASSSARQTTVWPRSANVMRGILIGKVILAVLILVFAVSAARANDIVNGSFETPLVPNAFFTNFLTGSTAITGWTVVGPEVSIVSTNYASFGFTFPAEDGKQWLDLTGDVSNRVEGVQQTFATTPGTTYNLSYFVGNQVDPGGPWGTTSTVDVLVNGALIQTSTNSMGAGGTTQVWEQFTTSFLATSSTTTLEFLNEDPLTDNSNGLDNVVVTPGSVVSTPEPSTLLLLLLAAVCALGFYRVRVPDIK